MARRLGWVKPLVGLVVAPRSLLVLGRIQWDPFAAVPQYTGCRYGRYREAHTPRVIWTDVPRGNQLFRCAASARHNRVTSRSRRLGDRAPVGHYIPSSCSAFYFMEHLWGVGRGFGWRRGVEVIVMPNNLYQQPWQGSWTVGPLALELAREWQRAGDMEVAAARRRQAEIWRRV